MKKLTALNDRQAGEVEKLVRAVLPTGARDRAAALAAAMQADRRFGAGALDLLLDGFELWRVRQLLPAEQCLCIVLQALDQELHGATAPRPTPVLRREASP